MSVDEPVEVVAYDPAWPTAFAVEAERLAATLAAWQVEIEHIGSTAVPGCPAKPIIDLLVGARSGDPSEIAATVAAAGYELLDEMSGRIYLRRRDKQQFNVHVVEFDGTIWRDNLALRDYLRSYPEDRDRYAAAKREAAEVAPMLLAYSERKAPALAELLEKARLRTPASLMLQTNRPDR